MESGKAEINRNTEIKSNVNPIDRTLIGRALENAKSFVEWSRDDKYSINEKENKKKPIDYVTEAWKKCSVEFREIAGIEKVNQYIIDNFDGIALDIKDGKPCMLLSDIKDCLRECKIQDIVKTVAYFYMWKCTIAMYALEYSGELHDNKSLEFLNIGGVNIVKEIADAYFEIITPSYLEKYHKGEELPPHEELLAKLIKLTEESVKAICYLEDKIILGIAGVVEDAIDFVIAGCARLAGNKELGDYLFGHQFTTKLNEIVEESFDGNQHIREAGNVAETIGEVGAYVALSVLSTGATIVGGIPIGVAAGATAFLGFAKAGQMTREIAEKTGGVGDKELLCGLGAGILSVLSVKLTSFAAKGLNSLFTEAANNIVKSGVSYAGAKALLTNIGGVLLEGATGGLIFSSQDIYRDIINDVYDEENGGKVDWKKVGKDIGTDVVSGAVVGLLFFAVGEIVNEIKSVSSYEGDLSIAERYKIKLETGWDNRIINCIKNTEQYEVYKGAGLHQEIINNRLCLCKEIDWDYVDPKTGMTNRERVEHVDLNTGRPAPLSPIDSKTGEKIELHHIGQKVDAPFAELAENSEHGDGKDLILHDKTKESWRRDPELRNQYQREKRNHWIQRGRVK